MGTYNLEDAFYCESKIAEIHQRQVEHGVCFDNRKAHWYVHILNERMLKLYLNIKRYLSYNPTSPNGQKSTKPFTKSGDYNSVTKKWFMNPEQVGGEFCKVEFEDPSDIMSKRQVLAKQLIKKGWEPASYTESGIPVIVKGGEPCPNLSKLGDLGESFKLYYIYSHRRNQILGFLKHIWWDSKGICRISAEANTIGTPTFRYRHSVVVNLPSPRAVFGHEMRSLFTVEKGYTMLGTDASGLELRCLSHYINDPDYTKTVTDGDIHTLHQEMAGLPTRAAAKEFGYAYLYGAGSAKLGSIIGGSVKEGKKMKDKFLKANPKLSKLIKDVTKQASTGFLRGLDGRRIKMRRSPDGEVMTHKALNTLLQSAGAVIMKYAVIALDTWIKELELDATIIIFYHDEVEISCNNKDLALVERLCYHWVTYAGQLLNLNAPMASDVNIGRNWAEVH